MRDAAERKQRFQIGQRRDRLFEKRPAIGDFLAGVGLFCGGTQRTALAITQSMSFSPSSGRRS